LTPDQEEICERKDAGRKSERIDSRPAGNL
jgi:hypothetical protein